MAAKALIVEDNEVLAYLFSHYIHEIGIDFDLAKNGIEALAISSNNKYDFVLMDVHMPVMGGIEATIKLTSLFPKTVVFAITSSDDREDYKQMILAGAKEYLIKPITPEKLTSTLAKYFPISII